MTHFKEGDKVRVVKPDNLVYSDWVSSALDFDVGNGWTENMDKYVGKTHTILRCSCDGYYLNGDCSYGFLAEWLELVEEEEKLPEGVIKKTYYVVEDEGALFDSLEQTIKYLREENLKRAVKFYSRAVGINSNRELCIFLEQHKEAVLEYLKD